MIPEFVSKVASKEDWIEAHDALFDLGSGAQLTGYNAEIWFGTNLKIRKTIARLKLAVEESILNGKKPLKVNFRLLVRQSGITNKSLCHPLRVHWIESEIAFLKRLEIKDKKNQNKLSEANKLKIEQFDIIESNLREQLLKEIKSGREKDREIQKLNKIIILLNKRLGGLEP